MGCGWNSSAYNSWPQVGVKVKEVVGPYEIIRNLTSSDLGIPLVVI